MKSLSIVSIALVELVGSAVGCYVAVIGTRGIVNGVDGIIVDSIAPATTFPKSAGAGALRTDTAEGNAPRAVPPAAPTVTSSVVTVGSDRYLVYNYDDLTTMNYAVVIPEGLKTVRGLLVNACYAGGDSRYDWTLCEYYRQFMHWHGFAFVGCTSTAGSPGSAPPPADDTPKAKHRRIFQAFQDAVQAIATASQHPELVNAPYVGVGFSAGGGFAFNLMVFAPEKTIAAASYSSPYNFKRRITPPPSVALLHVPSICITGELERFNVPDPHTDPSIGKATIDEVFVPYRPKGAEYAWLERQGLGHEYDENRQDVLGMPLLDAAVRARYPKDGDVTQGPLQLVPLDPSTGWIADNTTWKSGLTQIYPATQFQGDLGHSSWLQNEDLAFIYRAYATYDNPLRITSPGPCGPGTPALDPGSDVTITVDASQFPNWQKLEFYDGAKKLGTVTAAPTQFTATNLTPGYHVFSVLGTDAAGTVRTSDPVMVVVRRLPTADDAAPH